MTEREVETLVWHAPWLAPVRRRVRRWCGGSAGRTWVVAVSGGSDSVGLIRALHHFAPELELKLSVAHLNHGVRGEAAREDAAFVKDLAGTLGLPFDLGHWHPGRATHFEADARIARYRWLQEVAASRGATAVAVGHTRDDQAETILHRIIRGTGIKGLAGIPWCRPLRRDPPLVLVRPLLGVSRQAIREGLEALGQGYREDSSNADQSRTRARIRHDLLPRLVTYDNPRVAEALARLGSHAAATRRLLEHRLAEVEREVLATHGPDRFELHRDRLRALPSVLQAELIRHRWRKAGWPEAGMSARRWKRLVRLLQAGRPGEWDVGAGVVLKVTSEPSGLILYRPQKSAPEEAPIPPAPIELDLPGAAVWGSGRISVVLDPRSPGDETIDYDRVVPPLVVRAAAPGDRFAPLGMGGRTMRLNDFFRGRKQPPAARNRTPLLCDRLGIIWVAGQRISERVRLTASTTRTLTLRWEPIGSDRSVREPGHTHS